MPTIGINPPLTKAFLEVDEAGRTKTASYDERVVDVMNELLTFAWLTRDVTPYLVECYSERKESSETLSARVSLRSIRTGDRLLLAPIAAIGAWSAIDGNRCITDVQPQCFGRLRQQTQA